MRFLLFALLLLVLLMTPKTTHAFGEWNAQDSMLTSLESILVRLEFDIKRATESRSAHPDFLVALEGYLALLYSLLSPMDSTLEDTDSRESERASVPSIGSQITHGVEGIYFAMRLAPAATFPAGTNDKATATVDNPFWIAETEVTYELWYTVRQWALRHGYVFANAGMEGSHGVTGSAPRSRGTEPVTNVSFRDSLVWTNALSAMLGYDPVYTYEGRAIQNATNATACDNAIQENTSGFRLPTSNEWELAARYQGSDSSHGAIFSEGLYWTPGNYASGATKDVNNATATQEVAWYGANSSDGIRRVGLKQANGLKLYDMSGNAWEWCFDRHPTWAGSIVGRGGSWGFEASFLRTGYIHYNYPYGVNSFGGFRIARSFTF